MKKRVLALVLGLTMASVVQAESFRVEQYQQRQRINQGLRSGELTRHEASRLYGRHAALNREYVRDRRDGYGLTRVERRKLDAQQDRLSGSIYHQKNDRQHR